MQQGAQIGWDPESVNPHLPLAAKLLVLYLVAVVTVSLVKSASVLRMLWSFRRGSVRTTSSGDEFLNAWETCSNKIQSMKRLVVITLLWTTLIATLLLGRTLVVVVEQKVFGPAALGGGVAEVLTVFALGIFVCAVLYTACASYEGALLRRRESWNRARAITQNRSPGV